MFVGMNSFSLVKHPAEVLIIGRPGSGKTTAMKYLTYIFTSLGIVDWVVVFTGTPSGWSCIPRDWIVSENYSEKLVEMMKWASGPGKGKKGLLILDDITGVIKFQSKEWNELVTKFRHLGEKKEDEDTGWSIFIGIHYANQLSTTLKEAATHAFLFRAESKSSIEALYNTFASLGFESVREWKEYVSENTDYQSKHFIICSKQQNSGMPMFQPAVVPFDDVRLKNFQLVDSSEVE